MKRCGPAMLIVFSVVPSKSQHVALISTARRPEDEQDALEIARILSIQVNDITSHIKYKAVTYLILIGYFIDCDCQRVHISSILTSIIGVHVENLPNKFQYPYIGCLASLNKASYRDSPGQ